MKLWIDDMRPAPSNFWWCRSTNEAIRIIKYSEQVVKKYTEVGNIYSQKFDLDKRDRCYKKINEWKIELIDIDHDAGEYVTDGGDYIKLLDWLEETGRSYPIRIHSMNPVGCANMRAIIKHNGWKEIQ